MGLSAFSRLTEDVTPPRWRRGVLAECTSSRERGGGGGARGLKWWYLSVRRESSRLRGRAVHLLQQDTWLRLTHRNRTCNDIMIYMSVAVSIIVEYYDCYSCTAHDFSKSTSSRLLFILVREVVVAVHVEIVRDRRRRGSRSISPV